MTRKATATRPSTRTSAVHVRGLRKAYEGRTILDGIDLTVPVGTVFALLGPNGAGKTTVVKILSTLVTADAGDLRVGGHDLVADPHAVREAIGVTGQFSAVDGLITGEENMWLMADLHKLPRREGRSRVAALLERFDLVDAAKKPASTYSGGMRRRLDIAMTLVGEPRIIFLDEPTTGLDPRSRHAMWEIVRALVADGVTVFLTTQYLQEADELADRIAVLNGGGLVAEGTPDELKRLVPGGHVRLRFADADELGRARRLFREAERELGLGTGDDEAPTLHVPSDGGVRSVKAILDRVDGAGLEVEGLTLERPDLDDVFFAVTGHPGSEKEKEQEQGVNR